MPLMQGCAQPLRAMVHVRRDDEQAVTSGEETAPSTHGLRGRNASLSQHGDDGDDSLFGDAGIDALFGGNGSDYCSIGGTGGGTKNSCERP
jgi:Ca2+-binding RTX toxin-like protein